MHHSAPAPRSRGTLALFVIGLTACAGEPVAPAATAPTLDASRLIAGTTAVSGALGTPAWQSFRLLAPAIAVSSGGSTVAKLLETHTAPQPQLNATIPADLLGTTFVWDTTTQLYVADSTRSDAPANGVRHVLYPVNPFTGKPASTEELGYVDLTDEGLELQDGAAIRIVVSAAGVTWLDYALSITAAPPGATVEVDGFLSNGTERVEFHVDGGAQAGSGATFTYQLAVPSHDFQADATITSDGARNNVQERITVGAEVLGFTATHDGDLVQGAVAVNGVPFATLTGLADLPDIRRADGLPLTADEARALRGILDLTGHTLDFVGNLLAPLSP